MVTLALYNAANRYFLMFLIRVVFSFIQASTYWHILDVAACQFQKPGANYLCREIVAGNADGFPGGANRIHQDLHDLVQLFLVDLWILNENIIVDVFLKNIPIPLSDLHPIRSHPRFLGRAIRWDRMDFIRIF